MQRAFPNRNRFFAAALLAVVVVAAPLRARAASKEIIELQTQVQQLLDMVQRMQSTLDTKFGVMQHLIEQTADNANQMNATVNALQQKLNAQNESLGGKVDTASGQVQSLNDSVDELKSRIAKLDKSIQDLQGQLQNIQGGGATGGAAPNAADGQGSAMPPAGAPGVANSTTPPLKETFQAALQVFSRRR